MKSFTSWLLLLQTVFCTTLLIAQTNQDNGVAMIFYTSPEQSDTLTMKNFIETQGYAFDDPGLPRFIVANKSGKYMLGIGGFVKLKTNIDFEGVSLGNDFRVYNIAVPNNSTSGNQFHYEIEPRLFIKLITNTKYGRLVGYIEGDFRGINKTNRLRHAYITYRGFLFGQAWNTFVDIEVIPPVINAKSPINFADIRVPQIRYTRQFNPNIQVGAAAEMPNITCYYDKTTKDAAQIIPNFPFFLKYTLNKNDYLRLAGFIRNMTYGDLLLKKNRQIVGWGSSISNKNKINQSITTYAQVEYGKGIGEYIGDISGLGYDLIADSDRPGFMTMPAVFTWLAGIQYNINPKLYTTISLCGAEVYMTGSYSPDYYKQGLMGKVNLFYQFVPSAQAAVEYIYGRRKNMNNKTGHANRVEFLIQYNF